MASVAQSSTGSNSIVLVNPPHPPGRFANREGAGGLGAWSVGPRPFLYPPQGLAYAAAVLRNRAWSVQVLDAAAEHLSFAESVDRLLVRPTRMVAVQAAHITLDSDVVFLNLLRSKLPHTRLVVIGNSMAQVEHILLERTDVDHIAVGEPEAMLPPLCRAIAENVRLPRLVTVRDLEAPGVDEHGRVADLNGLPHPAWDAVPLARYGFVTVLSSRGCDDTCAFCPYVVGQGRYVRLREHRLVAQELEQLVALFRPRRVIMRDPVFARDRAHAEGVCREMIARRIRVSWECESRPEHFDPDLLRLLKEAGCTTVKVGLETTSEKMLRMLRRLPPGITADDYLQRTADVVAACRTLGLQCRLFVMTGLPVQTGLDIADTVTFLRTLQPVIVHARLFHRYPGLPVAPESSEAQRREGERQLAILTEAIQQMAPQPKASVGQTIRRLLGRRDAR